MYVIGSEPYNRTSEEDSVPDCIQIASTNHYLRQHSIDSLYACYSVILSTFIRP